MQYLINKLYYTASCVIPPDDFTSEATGLSSVHFPNRVYAIIALEKKISINVKSAHSWFILIVVQQPRTV